MHLKRLEIQGFKSFSSKTVLDFFGSEKGRHSITAIVGPNGSGKSNITDAIRWVMGEQRLKNIRGKKSSDIIFSGSETKGQMGAAEVTMILDNDDKVVLPDYEEITVTRRLYRSGESEYLINNQDVRLLDVHLLFAKLQFAQHAYTIIGQGTIDRFLTISPADRKEFLDDASGIKEFKIKQHQAVLKLNRSRDNIEQAQRLLQEVEPRLRLLSRQVNKLKKRQEVEIRLQEKQEQYYGTLFSNNEAELKVLGHDLDSVENEYRTNFRQLNDVQEELANLARQSSRQQIFDQLQQEHNKAVREKNEMEREMAIMQGKMHSEYSKVGQQNIGWLEKKITDLYASKKEFEAKVKDIELQLQSVQSEVSQTTAELDELENQKLELEQTIASYQSKIINSQHERDLRQYTGLLAVQAVLENADKFGKVYGMVAELGDVKEEYRSALEAAAGAYLSALVIKDEDVGRSAIEFLRTNRLGYATFLPLNKIDFHINELPYDVSAIEGVMGLAVDLVKFSDRFESIFKFVFRQTVVVSDLVAAKRAGIGKYRMVTLRGDIVEKSGVMKGGFRQKRRSDVGFDCYALTDKNNVGDIKIELQALESKLQELKVEIEKKRAQLSEQSGKREVINAKLEVINNEVTKNEGELSSLEHDLLILKSGGKNMGSLVKELTAKRDQLEKNILAKDDEIVVIAEKIIKFNDSEEQKKKKVFALQDQMQDIQTRVNKLLMDRNELRVQIARLDTKQENIVEEVRNEMSADIKTIIAKGIELLDDGELEPAVAKIQKLKYQLSLIGGIDDEVVEEYDQTKEKYDFLVSQIDDLEKAIKDLDKMIVELDSLMKKKRQVAFKKIRKEFIRYIEILFGGGKADMKEIYGYEDENDEILNQVQDDSEILDDGKTEKISKKKREKIVTGVDVTVNPPGKKIKHIETLSGGERTLASIAMICAVLRYNPSPFVVLDEVEAALDEVNTTRFSQIITELAQASQFIIITHNRTTMHSADALYGVTMGGDGMSRLLSVDLGDEIKG